MARTKWLAIAITAMRNKKPLFDLSQVCHKKSALFSPSPTLKPLRDTQIRAEVIRMISIY
jgi:hypothetical protein